MLKYEIKKFPSLLTVDKLRDRFVKQRRGGYITTLNYQRIPDLKLKQKN